MILFAGYELLKLFNVRRMGKVLTTLVTLSEKTKTREISEVNQEFVSMASDIRFELGWMFYVELLYPVCMVFLLFSPYFYTGAAILSLSLLAYVGLRALLRKGMGETGLVILLFIEGILSIFLLLFPLFLLK
jgi:hypothetical protein